MAAFRKAIGAKKKTAHKGTVRKAPAKSAASNRRAPKRAARSTTHRGAKPHHGKRRVLHLKLPGWVHTGLKSAKGTPAHKKAFAYYQKERRAVLEGKKANHTRPYKARTGHGKTRKAPAKHTATRKAPAKHHAKRRAPAKHTATRKAPAKHHTKRRKHR